MKEKHSLLVAHEPYHIARGGLVRSGILRTCVLFVRGQ